MSTNPNNQNPQNMNFKNISYVQTYNMGKIGIKKVVQDNSNPLKRVNEVLSTATANGNSENKTKNKSSISQATKEKISNNMSPRIEKLHNNISPISLTNRIGDLETSNKNKNSNNNILFSNQNLLIDNNSNNNIININNNQSNSNTSHTSKSVNSKYNGNSLLKSVGINNTKIYNFNLRKDPKNSINKKINNNNFPNNNQNIKNNKNEVIANMNNMNSKNKKKGNSNSSNLNVGMLSFSTSNGSLSINGIVNCNYNNNDIEIKNNPIANNINELKNNLNDVNSVNSNILETQQNKKNKLNLCLDYISNNSCNNNPNKYNLQNNLINNNFICDDKNKMKLYPKTKSVEQANRNPKFSKNEKGNGDTKGIEGKNGVNEGENCKADDYKKLIITTKKNVCNIMTTNQNENSKLNSKKSGNEVIKKCVELSTKKYNNPEEMHFALVKVTQNIKEIKEKY